MELIQLSVTSPNYHNSHLKSTMKSKDGSLWTSGSYRGMNKNHFSRYLLVVITQQVF